MSQFNPKLAQAALWVSLAPWYLSQAALWAYSVSFIRLEVERHGDTLKFCVRVIFDIYWVMSCFSDIKWLP